jgi:putative DNA primase/helicase
MSDEAIRKLVDEAQEFIPPNDNQPSPPIRQPAVGSDVDLAKCVLDDLSAQLGRIVFAEGAFWHFIGTHWIEVPLHRLQLAVQQYDGRTYLTQNNTMAQIKLNETRVKSVIKMMEPIVSDPEFFATVPPGINCSSGLIRFEPDGTPKLEPHDPEHRRRHVLKGQWLLEDREHQELRLAFSYLGCLLRGVFQDDPDAGQKIALLQEVAGSTALGYATRLRQPRAIILSGATAENGKSQVLDLYRGLLPPDAIASLPAGKMGDERLLPGLIGKHLNAADELSGAAAIASEIFKAVVTGEPVTGREVYRAAVTFRPMAQHIFCTNMLPSFTGGIDRGVQRRLLVVPFNRVIPKGERVEHIGQLIGEREPNLLLAWAVEGASRLIRQREFTIPPSSAEALKQWLHLADPVVAWVATCVRVIDPASTSWPDTKVKSSRAYEAFKRFAIREGFNEHRLPAPFSLSQRLMAHRPTIQTKHFRDGNYLIGLEIEHYDLEAEEPPFSVVQAVRPHLVSGLLLSPG